MNRTLDLRRTLALGLAAVALSACASESKTSPNAASPERQAESEYDLSRDAFYKGHFREALDHAQRANTLDDQNAKALYFTAVIYLGFCSSEGMASPDCRLKDAEELARKAIKVEDRFRDARNLLGRILILEQRYSDAMVVLEPLTKDPAYSANYLAWGNYGWAQVKAGKLDEGIVSLRNSVTEPRFCTGDFRLGMAYEQKGDFVAAEKSFTDAVEVPSADCRRPSGRLVRAGQGQAEAREHGRRDGRLRALPRDRRQDRHREGVRPARREGATDSHSPPHFTRRPRGQRPAVAGQRRKHEHAMRKVSF